MVGKQFEKIVRKNDILFESSFIIKMILRNALHYLDKITIAFIYFLLITSVLINGIYNNYIFLNDKYDECVSRQLEIKNSFIYNSIYSIPNCDSNILIRVS